MLSDSMTVVATDDHLATSIECETVILQLESGTYYGLNEVASHLWDLLQEPRTVAELHDELCTTYDVSAERCRRDVESTLTNLADIDLVELEPERSV
ncbi:PqqD family protein [Natrarchaeobius halalkaliphilus]|uniref:PqqD family protein n=2 Tax=Natrarchaeobius halalkaliphilus TaxID=1679091 RepID=A0A3N6P2B8_9EURY|nr:PqqD family protein [Natrarchaeobius halalkaliphilus]